MGRGRWKEMNISVGLVRGVPIGLHSWHRKKGEAGKYRRMPRWWELRTPGFHPPNKTGSIQLPEVKRSLCVWLTVHES